MIRLSQRDPRWAAKKLGASPLTIGQKGCTTTCVSMASDYFGHLMTPDQIAGHKDWYTKPGHPQGSGLIIWGQLKMPGMKYLKSDYSRNDANIQAALADPNKIALLTVNHRAHWVLAIKYLGGGKYLVADPWTGKDVEVISMYHQIDGAAYFGRA